MKPNLLFTALLLLANAVLMAQKPFSGKKIDRYFDENEREISREKFDELNVEQIGTSVFTFELDSFILHSLEKNPAVGQIGKQTLDEIRDLLRKQTGAQIDSLDILVIQYFPGIEHCPEKTISPLYKKRLRELDKTIKKTKGVSGFYFHKKGAELGGFKNVASWHDDESQVLQRTFFWMDYPCKSYVIIKPDGTFCLQKGLTLTAQILKMVNAVADNDLFDSKTQESFDEKMEAITHQEFQATNAKAGQRYKFTEISGLVLMEKSHDSDLISDEKPPNSGSISLEKVAEIRHGLERASGQTIDPAKSMAIYFYHGEDRCNSSGSGAVDRARSAEESLKKLEKYPQVVHFNIKRMGQKVGENNSLILYFDDPDQILEKTFFQYPSPCGSFILIRADGRYKVMRGEYDNQHMMKLVKSMH